MLRVGPESPAGDPATCVCGIPLKTFMSLVSRNSYWRTRDVASLTGIPIGRPGSLRGCGIPGGDPRFPQYIGQQLPLSLLLLRSREIGEIPRGFFSIVLRRTCRLVRLLRCGVPLVDRERAIGKKNMTMSRARPSPRYLDRVDPSHQGGSQGIGVCRCLEGVLGLLLWLLSGSW